MFLPAVSIASMLFLWQAPADRAAIQTGARLVLVNVVARDKHGKPIDNLSRDDFALFDNGQRRSIAFFALERGEQPAPATASALTFSNRPASGSPAVTAFLFDELNTPLGDQQLAKRDFLRYLRRLQPEERVAVFVLGDSLSLLHDFSQDTASLIAVLEKHPNRESPETSATQPASFISPTGDAATDAQWGGFVQSSGQAYADYAETVRALRTAQALEAIAGHLAGIPGRKTLIWISDGFPIQLGLQNKADIIPQSNPNARQSSRSRGDRPTGGSSAGAHTSGVSQPAGSRQQTDASSAAPSGSPGPGESFESDLERAIRALNEADVAVFPVNAAGVAAAPMFQANRSSAGRRNRLPGAAPVNFNYETLEALATETGGLAFHDINDLSAAFDEAASDARVSYSLAFAPPEDSLDGAYHRLEVTANRPGVKLRYRPGFVASSKAAVAPTLAEAVASPAPLTGIGFTVSLDPVEGGYKASITIDPRNITLQPDGNGRWNGALQFLVVVGKVEQLTAIPLNLTEAKFRDVQARGLVIGARVKTPPGTAGFSLGFRDVASGMVGTLHVNR